jgi:hypothetical protein
MFRRDRGMAVNDPQALEQGQYFVFFRVIYVDAPREVEITVEKRFTGALRRADVSRQNGPGELPGEILWSLKLNGIMRVFL